VRVSLTLTLPNPDSRSSHQVWAALRRAHLAPVVEAAPAGLDMVLSEGGSPLSAGQKQLAALARALLKHSKARRPDVSSQKHHTSRCSIFAGNVVRS